MFQIRKNFSCNTGFQPVLSDLLTSTTPAQHNLARAGSPCYGVALLSALILALMFNAARAEQNNVDLSTVPKRDTVQLTIYNSEDITLVRETRSVTFKRGMNPLQFSWANTLIDPSSVQIKFLSKPDKLDLLDTTFPHDKPQMLYWNVKSDFDGEGQIEITYFTSGITWKADYLAIANPAETQMHLESFVRVFNNSGEEYENAQIRLVVGTINLVEKIAQLAQIPMKDVSQLGAGERMNFQRQVMLGSIAKAMPAATASPSGSEVAAQPKEIIKEGLSEYFIYTVDGTETIANGWSKRMRSFDGVDVPFKIQYRYRPAEYGDQLVRMYLLTNDKDSKLGTTPLPDGMVRVFRENGRDGLSFLAAQQIKYVPISDKIELNLGVDPNVIFELSKQRAWRDNIWLHIHGANVFRRVGDGNVQVDVRSTVAGWDDHEVMDQKIRNYTAKPIDMEIRRLFPGHIVIKSALKPTLHDYQTVQIHTNVEAGKTADLMYEVIRHEGHNAKQNNVTLEEGEVKL